MVPSRGVGILSPHELEGIHLLSGESIVQDDIVLGANRLSQPHTAAVVMDALEIVRVQGSRIDVGAVRRFVRISVQQLLNIGPPCRIRSQRRAFFGCRDKNVSIDVACCSYQATFKQHRRTAPEPRAVIESERVVASGLDASDLKERTGAGDAVLVRPNQFAMGP